MPKRKTAAAVVLELATELAAAQAKTPGLSNCARCAIEFRPGESNAACPEMFCSNYCERAFVRERLGSLSTDDCIRLQERLADLLAAADARMQQSKP